MCHHKFIFCLSLLTAILFISCQADDLNVTVQGSLKLSIEGISSETTETRSTPAELKEKNGLSAIDFHMSVTRQGYESPMYNGSYTDKEMKVPVGSYDITATYGENPLLGRDTPYYIGTTTAVVEEDKTTEASLTCKVANSLISARFGKNLKESERFERFYTSCKMTVHVGNYSMDITSGNPLSSIYLQPGQTFSLSFSGKLKADNDRLVTCELNNAELPTTLNAAQHLIVTLTLPDPENATVINISKVEMEEVTLEETIPLSWLPVPQAKPEHQYDNEGNLVGTNVSFSNSYPNMEWKTVVTDANGTEVRTIQGEGILNSLYNENTEWPYLPKGNYKATYYIVLDDTPTRHSSREFSIPDPNLQITMGGYTSYSLYLKGEVDEANNCDAYTIYNPSATMNVSPTLLNNSKYNSNISLEYGNNSKNVSAISYVELGDQTNVTPSFTAYNYSASANFAGSNATNNIDFYITGLPILFDPPTEEQGWVGSTTINLHWEDDNVQLGRDVWDNNPRYITYSKFAIPRGTHVAAQYNVNVHGATVETTLTLSMGNQIYFEKTSGSGLFHNEDEFYNGTVSFSLTENTSTAKASNSYGKGATRSHIYSLGYQYGK